MIVIHENPFLKSSITKNTCLRYIGNTPLVQLKSITKDFPETMQIWGKLEGLNPGGSVKDRAAMMMILKGIESGELTPDKVILDSTSGNTGIALAMIGSVLKIPVELCVPGNASGERIQRMEAYGAKVIFSSPLEGSDGAILEARKLYEENPDKYFKPDQYANPANPLAHVMSTGPEIWKQTNEKVTHFVAAIGTTGTIMGTGRFLKGKNPNIQIIAAEPDDAFHGLEGLKHMESSLVPAIFHPEELDGKISVPTEPAYALARKLAREEGIFAGQSSGAAVYAAREVALKLLDQGQEEACIVTILCDSGDKYYSKGLWDFSIPYKDDR
ncbi:MAG: pyridoxal-phosphate dependent enzyme [Candidatus Hydrogenedentota bacterium]|nr:MAG: pyridoxal-phosphate dependent enzyme [Candidatus Hydrogenedentota bacterium]